MSKNACFWPKIVFDQKTDDGEKVSNFDNFKIDFTLVRGNDGVISRRDGG